jgi:protein SCO1/2
VTGKETAVKTVHWAAGTGAWLVLLLGVNATALAAERDTRSDRRELLAHATGHDDHAHHRTGASVQGKYERSVHVYKIPDVTLLDMTGAKVPLAAALGGDAPLMLNFIFTTCTSICPLMSVTFSEVQKRLGAEGDRVRMVSISIDPEQDSPAQLSAFATKHGAGPGWQFLTGRTTDITTVQRAFDAYRGNKMSHAPSTYIRTTPTGPWVRLDGLASATDIVAEYRRALRR